MNRGESRQVRANYDAKTIVVYQAYAPHIAQPAVVNQRFVPPFSFGRMTWIKPSFLWMMERSNWGQKHGQEQTLAVRITRAGWDEALSKGVLTAHDPSLYKSFDDWQAQMDAAVVHVQWDPERSLRGANLPMRAIQVGLSRHIIQRYVDEWIISIEDLTPLVLKIYRLLADGRADQARRLLPPERVYPADAAVAKRLGITSS